MCRRFESPVAAPPAAASSPPPNTRVPEPRHRTRVHDPGICRPTQLHLDLCVSRAKPAPSTHPEPGSRTPFLNPGSNLLVRNSGNLRMPEPLVGRLHLLRRWDGTRVPRRHHIRHRSPTHCDRKSLALLHFAKNLRQPRLGFKRPNFRVYGFSNRHKPSKAN